MTSSPVTKFKPEPPRLQNRTFARQSELPKLPVPPLEDTCRRYLQALEGLQDPRDHEETKKAVEDFLKNDGPRIQQRLIAWAENKARYAHESIAQLTTTHRLHIIATSKTSGEHHCILLLLLARC